jgi:hypothetical protein
VLTQNLCQPFPREAVKYLATTTAAPKGRPLVSRRKLIGSQTTFTILFALRQRVQTFTDMTVPPTMVLMLRRLGRQVRRVRFLAWLTVLPKMVPLPHTSHLLDILFRLRFLKFYKKLPVMHYGPERRGRNTMEALADSNAEAPIV